MGRLAGIGPSSLRTYTVTGLTNGTFYTFELRYLLVLTAFGTSTQQEGLASNQGDRDPERIGRRDIVALWSDGARGGYERDLQP